MSKHQCPHCGSSNVRTSYKRRSDLLHVVYRCRNCKRHFTVEKSRRQLLTLAGLAVSLLVVVLYTLITLFGREDVPAAASAETEPIPTLTEQDRQLAQQGDADAQYRLAMDLWSGTDYQKAIPWLKNAAQLGHVEAKYQLGNAYLYGRGTVQNYRYALEQFSEAAKLGHLESQYTLGTMFRDGMGTESNKKLAYVWLNVAAARGHGIASNDRDRLSMHMDPQEIVSAQEASIKELHEELGTIEASTDPASQTEPPAPSPASPPPTDPPATGAGPSLPQKE